MLQSLSSRGVSQILKTFDYLESESIRKLSTFFIIELTHAHEPAQSLVSELFSFTPIPLNGKVLALPLSRSALSQQNAQDPPTQAQGEPWLIYHRATEPSAPRQSQRPPLLEVPRPCRQMGCRAARPPQPRRRNLTRGQTLPRPSHPSNRSLYLQSSAEAPAQPPAYFGSEQSL